MRVVTADLHAYWRFQSDYLMRIPSVQSVKTDVPWKRSKAQPRIAAGIGVLCRAGKPAVATTSSFDRLRMRSTEEEVVGRKS